MTSDEQHFRPRYKWQALELLYKYYPNDKSLKRKTKDELIAIYNNVCERKRGKEWIWKAK